MLMVEEKKSVSRGRYRPAWAFSVPEIMAASQRLREMKASKTVSHEAILATALVEYGLSGTGVDKVSRIVRNEALADPKNWNRLPTSWANLYELSLIPEERLREMISKEDLSNITKFKIWKLRNKTIGVGRRNKVGNHSEITLRDMIAAPGGMDITNCCRQGLGLEEKGLNSREAARAIGMGQGSYQMVSSLIRLSEMDGLSPNDKTQIQEALYQINRTRNVRRYYEKVKHIAALVWGEHPKSRKTSGAADKRLNAFQNIIEILSIACKKALERQIPYLPDQERAKALQALHVARSDIGRLMSKLRRTTDDDLS